MCSHFSVCLSTFQIRHDRLSELPARCSVDDPAKRMVRQSNRQAHVHDRLGERCIISQTLNESADLVREPQNNVPTYDQRSRTDRLQFLSNHSCFIALLLSHCVRNHGVNLRTLRYGDFENAPIRYDQHYGDNRISAVVYYHLHEGASMAEHRL